mmetsp:Transcript_35421/g.110439  ORF Transcript_35421/g.110439 Transcript_35421/m.110439 type:complete len:235 (+) Transcript_35421:204-908(+)
MRTHARMQACEKGPQKGMGVAPPLAPSPLAVVLLRPSAASMPPAGPSVTLDSHLPFSHRRTRLTIFPSFTTTSVELDADSMEPLSWVPAAAPAGVRTAQPPEGPRLAAKTSRMRPSKPEGPKLRSASRISLAMLSTARDSGSWKAALRCKLLLGWSIAALPPPVKDAPGVLCTSTRSEHSPFLQCRVRVTERPEPSLWKTVSCDSDADDCIPEGTACTSASAGSTSTIGGALSA